MSILISTNNIGLEQNSSNFSNPQSCTKLLWAKLGGTPTGFLSLMGAANAAFTATANMDAGSSPGLLEVGTAPGVFSSFGSQPNFTNWNCYALTMGTAGSNSLTGYWQDNAGGGFVSHSMTGVNFTNALDFIGFFYAPVSITAAFYMEWNTVLTPAQLATQFSSSTPTVLLGNLHRYLPLANAATAGLDQSGNGFNMTVLGTLSDGPVNPSFSTDLQAQVCL